MPLFTHFNASLLSCIATYLTPLETLAFLAVNRSSASQIRAEEIWSSSSVLWFGISTKIEIFRRIEEFASSSASSRLFASSSSSPSSSSFSSSTFSLSTSSSWYNLFASLYTEFPLPYLYHFKTMSSRFERLKVSLTAKLPLFEHSLMKGVRHEIVEQLMQRYVSSCSCSFVIPYDYLVFMQFCGGQSFELPSFRSALREGKSRSPFIGLFGGYSVYNYLSFGYLTPYNLAVSGLISTPETPVIFVACDRLQPQYHLQTVDRTFCLNSQGQVVRFTRVQMPPPSAPSQYASRSPPSSRKLLSYVVASNFTEFLTKHVKCVEEEAYLITAEQGIQRHIEDTCSSSCVTEGIRIRAQVLFMPEYSQMHQYLYTYRISIDTTEECNFTARLTHRHWVVEQADGSTEIVEGEGVIGLYPVVKPHMDTFYYSSMTQCSQVTGRMWGYFEFVDSKTQRIIQAKIEPFCFDPERNQC